MRHRVIPDRVEAGTFAVAICITKGEALIQDCRPDHLDLVLDKLVDAGAEISVEEDGLRVAMNDRPESADFVTLPYPGFPTDLQPQIMSMLSVARGTSIITENFANSTSRSTSRASCLIPFESGLLRESEWWLGKRTKKSFESLRTTMQI